jgi:integrase
MAKIKNKEYKEFLETSLIRTLNTNHLDQALKNVKGIHGKYIAEGRSLLIILYFTGARPAEVLRMIAKDIQKDGHYITAFVPPVKNGRPRRLYFAIKNKYMKEVLKFANNIYPDQILFWHYKGNHTRKYTTKKGIKKEYREDTNKIRYHVSKWFTGVLSTGTIPPYFLRHNRFSSLAENNATDNEIMIYKGAKDKRSINYYIHMSKFNAKKVARKVV